MGDSCIIPCPRNWVVPRHALPNESLDENYRRLFGDYLPGMTVTKVTPFKYVDKRRCKWQVQFTNFQEAEMGSEKGLRKSILLQLNQSKPRNSNIESFEKRKRKRRVRRVQFTDFQEAETRSEKGPLKSILVRSKPRNAKIESLLTDYFVVTYGVACDCPTSKLYKRDEANLIQYWDWRNFF